MGTRLIAADPEGGDPALANLTCPDAVRALHARDVTAGSDAILTNSFGGNRSWLTRSGRGDDVVAINRRAVALARDAAGPDRFVLGSIGPTAGEGAREQAEFLASSGVDGLILETHRSAVAVASLAGIRPHVDLPILVSLFAFDEPVADAARRLADAGADVLGVNCVRPDQALRWVVELSRATALPLLCKPSASHPDWPPIPPDEFASDVPTWLDHGVRLLGGCCGATAAHVAALRSALDRVAADGV
jgi:methionine synthase I (cobalamin-dependent)